MFKFLNTINFNYKIFKRVIVLLPRKSKKVKMLYVEYLNSATTNTHLGLKYKFSNAVWFDINGIKTLSNNIIIPRQYLENELVISVYGFFRKSTYKLHLKENYITASKIQS